jgi:hypothetical protein
MAGRASIAMASKAGGITIEDFYKKLKPLGFVSCIADDHSEVPIEKELKPHNYADWDNLLEKYSGNLVTIDVRELEMPGPMMTILESLDILPQGHALFVYHKRIPLFLLPELSERNLEYRVKQTGEAEVQLLIFKP